MFALVLLNLLVCFAKKNHNKNENKNDPPMIGQSTEQELGLFDVPQDATFEIEHAETMEQQNDPVRQKQKLQLLIDIETVREKFLAERAKRVAVLDELQRNLTLITPKMTSENITSKGPLENECRLILKEELKRLQERKFENFLPPEHAPVTFEQQTQRQATSMSTLATKDNFAPSTEQPKQIYNYFPYQNGYFFEGNWLYEDLIANDIKQLHSPSTSEFEKCLAKIKPKKDEFLWFLFVGDSNLLNQFRALIGKINDDPDAKIDDSGLFGDYDYYFSSLHARFSFRYIGSESHLEKVTQMVDDRGEKAYRWIGLPTNNWDYGNVLEWQPHKPYRKPLERPFATVIGIGSQWSTNVESEKADQLVESLFSWLGGTQIFWRTVSPTTFNNDIEKVNEKFYNLLQKNNHLNQLRWLYVKPFFDDKQQIKLKEADGINDNRKLQDILNDILYDFLCRQR